MRNIKLIKQLAVEAGVTIDGMGYGEGNIEEFARLIILECAKVASEERNPANLNYKPSERFSEAIKQHFGI